MDLGKAKGDADLKADYTNYKVEYNSKKDKARQQEVGKMQTVFKDFIKEDGAFELTETKDKITASYNSSNIVLITDEYINSRQTSMSVQMKIETIDGETKEVYTTVQSNSKELINDINPPSLSMSKEDIMRRDLEYYKAFVNDEIEYSFKYKVKSSKVEYDTFLELLKEL